MAMNEEARDKAIKEILIDFDLSTLTEHFAKITARLAYAAGYRACRDEAIRILAAKREHKYDV